MFMVAITWSSSTHTTYYFLFLEKLLFIVSCWKQQIFLSFEFLFLNIEFLGFLLLMVLLLLPWRLTGLKGSPWAFIYCISREKCMINGLTPSLDAFWKLSKDKGFARHKFVDATTPKEEVIASWCDLIILLKAMGLEVLMSLLLLQLPDL